MRTLQTAVSLILTITAAHAVTGIDFYIPNTLLQIPLDKYASQGVTMSTTSQNLCIGDLAYGMGGYHKQLFNCTYEPGSITFTFARPSDTVGITMSFIVFGQLGSVPPGQWKVNLYGENGKLIECLSGTPHSDSGLIGTHLETLFVTHPKFDVKTVEVLMPGTPNVWQGIAYLGFNLRSSGLPQTQ